VRTWEPGWVLKGWPYLAGGIEETRTTALGLRENVRAFFSRDKENGP